MLFKLEILFGRCFSIVGTILQDNRHIIDYDLTYRSLAAFLIVPFIIQIAKYRLLIERRLAIPRVFTSFR